MDDSIKSLTAGLQKLAASETANKTPVPFHRMELDISHKTSSAGHELAHEIQAYLQKKREQDERAAAFDFVVG